LVYIVDWDSSDPDVYSDDWTICEILDSHSGDSDWRQYVEVYDFKTGRWIAGDDVTDELINKQNYLNIDDFTTITKTDIVYHETKTVPAKSDGMFKVADPGQFYTINVATGTQDAKRVYDKWKAIVDHGPRVDARDILRDLEAAVYPKIVINSDDTILVQNVTFNGNLDYR